MVNIWKYVYVCVFVYFKVNVCEYLYLCVCLFVCFKVNVGEMGFDEKQVFLLISASQRFRKPPVNKQFSFYLIRLIDSKTIAWKFYLLSASSTRAAWINYIRYVFLSK